MRFEGHTDLEQLQYLPSDLRTQLRSLWVDSVEEYLSLLAATDPSLVTQAFGAEQEAIEQSRTHGFTLVGAPKIDTLMQARPGGPLGCLIDPQLVQQFDAQGQIGPMREHPPVGFDKPLPPAVRLMNRMPAVKNQGQRGTCVSFGSVALREFLAGSSVAFSEQFLYWACKELDGTTEAGTYLHTAMAALSKYGVCRAATWPYNSEQNNSNESQGPPPRAALDEARRYKMPNARAVEPSLVEHYKQVLAGESGAPSMPVTIATLVFNSWFMSPETHRTGKLTLPLPFERPVGGHAWCVVGYVDEWLVPGGGYFIVRNSWGTTWASHSPEAPGHALMPYTYVAKYAAEAFTGPVGMAMTTLSPGETGDEMTPYVRILEKEERDIEERLLPAGAKVLFNPAAPAEFMEDTPANRQDFTRRDRSWSAPTRSQVWFPEKAAATASLQPQFASTLSLKQSFLAAIDENLSAAKGTSFPDIGLPFFVNLLPWEPQIKSAALAADLSVEAASQLKLTAGVPDGLPWPAPLEDTLKTINAAKVYRIEGAGVQVHAVAAFVTPLEVQKGAAPRMLPPDAHAIELVRSLHKKWCEKNRAGSPAFTYFTLGSASPWPAELKGLSGGDFCVTLASPEGKDGWAIQAPPSFAAPLSVRDFLERLRPETRQQRISRIKRFVDDLSDEGFEGNIHIDRIKERTGYRRTAIRDALLALQDSGHYRLYKTQPQGLLAVRREDGGRREISAATFRRSWLVQHLMTWLSPAAGVGLWIAKDAVAGHPLPLGAVVLLLPLAYIGKLIDKKLHRLTEEKD